MDFHINIFSNQYNQSHRLGLLAWASTYTLKTGVPKQYTTLAHEYIISAQIWMSKWHCMCYNSTLIQCLFLWQCVVKDLHRVFCCFCVTCMSIMMIICMAAAHISYYDKIFVRLV